MRIESLKVSDTDDDRQYTAQQVINALDGTASARTTIPATYGTDAVSPTVYYTALYPDGSILTARRTSGVTLNGAGLYEYDQPRSVDFVAVWDEGDPNDFTSEYIMVGS